MNAMRETVQRIGRLSRSPAASRLPPKELSVDVLDLVDWVYGKQLAHLVDGRGIGLYEGERVAAGITQARNAGNGSSLRAFEGMMRLGCIIDRQGSDSGELHPIAEVVHDLVAHQHAIIIVKYAARCSRPIGGSIQSNLAPAWKLEPAYDVAGLPRPGSFRVVRDKNRNAIYCPLVFDHAPRFISSLRSEWICWHAALSRLAKACRAARPRLRGIQVVGPNVPLEPWKSGPP